jgi:alkylation response protein AidB-like acyl-CoA dehydrogenase
MKEAGIYRMWIPRAYGGLEVDPMTALRVLEEAARIDSAAAWNLAISLDTALPYTSARGGPPRSTGEETRSWRARCFRLARQFLSRVGFVSTGALRSRAAAIIATGSS